MKGDYRLEEQKHDKYGCWFEKWRSETAQQIADWKQEIEDLEISNKKNAAEEQKQKAEALYKEKKIAELEETMADRKARYEAYKAQYEEDTAEFRYTVIQADAALKALSKMDEKIEAQGE